MKPFGPPVGLRGCQGEKAGNFVFMTRNGHENKLNPRRIYPENQGKGKIGTGEKEDEADKIGQYLSNRAGELLKITAVAHLQRWNPN